MKQHIKLHEKQRIKDLLLSCEEPNYKLGLQLLSIFFDKREARRFIWHECFSKYIPSCIIWWKHYYKLHHLKSSKKDFHRNIKNFEESKIKWLHSGNKQAFQEIYYWFNPILYKHDLEKEETLLWYLLK